MKTEQLQGLTSEQLIEYITELEKEKEQYRKWYYDTIEKVSYLETKLDAIKKMIAII